MRNTRENRAINQSHEGGIKQVRFGNHRNPEISYAEKPVSDPSSASIRATVPNRGDGRCLDAAHAELFGFQTV